jgi:predicted nucleic acid-binding Zn ribbon protein
MRTKPVRRDEVRIKGAGAYIATLPADSVEKDDWGRYVPIKRLWTPLLRSLNRGRKKQSVTCPQPYSYYARTCPYCGRRFFGVYRSTDRLCSDHCVEAVHNQARAARSQRQSQATAQARAAARAGRTCQTCGEPIEARRSTMRFCSTRCRVAAYRQRARSASPGKPR